MLLLLQYTLIFASVLLLVALGGCFSEHSGVINIGLEGIMVMGALGGALMMKFLPAGTSAFVVVLLTVLASILLGMIYSLLLAVAAVNFKADQTLVGTAMNLLGTAAATVFVKAMNTAADPDNVSSTIQYLDGRKAFLVNIGGFEFNWCMLLAVIALVIAYVVLYKTRFGLRLCACGEHPQAADSVGINVYRMRYAGVLISGVLGGLGGIVYIIAGVSEWKFENGVAGFGFLALAVMIFGQWKPTRIALAALLFGFFRALGNVYSGFDLLSNLNLPSSVYNMLPYVISLVVLALFTPILAGWAIKFSAVEKFLIILFALTVIAALSRGQMLRGLWIGMLGVLVAMMNQFSVNNEYRMVPEFLESQMQSGFQLFPVLIGLFAVSEMLQQCETGMHASYSKDDTLEVKNNVKFSLLHDFKGQIINVFRSALLGTFMGILPGVGGSAASLIAYSQAKSWSKHPELLGTGVPEGLIASETSNNGLTGGALVPLLSLGIPGDSTTAVLIGAFMLQGIQVGPLFITNNPVIWNTILVALLCCNILMYLVMFFPVKLLAKIVLIPQERLYPVVLMMCTVGAYATLNGRMFDVWCLLLFGIVGLLIKKFHFPVSCFLIGFILGGDLEDYFIQVLTAYNGSLTGLFVRPMSWVIWALIILSVVYAVLDNRKAKRQEKELSGKQ